MLEISTLSGLSSIWLREILNDTKVQSNSLNEQRWNWAELKDMSYFCPSSQTFKPAMDYAVLSPSLNIWCAKPKSSQLVLIRPSQTLKNWHQWSKAGGQASLAKLTKHFCKITCRLIKLPVIFLHEWDPKRICVPVDVLFKLKQKVNNCPICNTENMGPEGWVFERQIKWERKKKGIPGVSCSKSHQDNF